MILIIVSPCSTELLPLTGLLKEKPINPLTSKLINQ